MKFSFVAKHRGIWPAGWLCGALGVSRGGFYAWLTRPPSKSSRRNEELAGRVRTSFLQSDRTYGARRVWHDLLAEGVSCGLHRIERLMQVQGFRARLRPATVQMRAARLLKGLGGFFYRACIGNPIYESQRRSTKARASLQAYRLRPHARGKQTNGTRAWLSISRSRRAHCSRKSSGQTRSQICQAVHRCKR